MKSINLDNIDSLKTELENGISVMYGAGGNGERLLKIFQEHSIAVHYFCDDDYNKWETSFHDIRVISFDKLKEFCQNEKVNVILTSVFAGPILGRLEGISAVVYEPFSMLIDRYYKNSFYKVSLPKEEIEIFQNKVQIVIDKINDMESKQILKKILNVVSESGRMRYSYFFDVVSREDCYFIKEVLEALPEHPIVIDCGGFTGDLMTALDRHGIAYDKVYSFEVNQELFGIMQENIRKNSLEGRFLPINKGVWDASGKAYLNVKSDDIAGGKVDNDTDGVAIDVVSIDDYFGDMKFDFIKMDIEGAELNAIGGGISSIRNCRPIMAISLYHSVSDVVEIPLYLFEKLENYHFLIRHHSFIDSEIVLYCIPDERMKEE